jgi:coenzyme F420 biosynthesis associated uncharacterized protein
MSMGVTPAIDWDTAQRVAELIAGSPPSGGVLSRSVQPLAHDFARRVGDYTGLELPEELPPLETVDRPGWIAANLKTMRPLLETLTEPSQGTESSESPETGRGTTPHEPPNGLSGALHAASGHLLGAQFGTVTGLLSQRVLGQYDVSLLDPDAPPRLLLLAPNLAAAARTLNVDREDLLAWVSIHEITHAVQFSGAPWLREHLGGMIRELLQGIRVSLAGSSDEAKDEGEGDGGRSGLPDPRELLDRARSGELRELLDRARRGEVLRITLGEDRWRLVERMQSTMSLVEGHAEHTMDAVGEDVLPSLPRLRTAMTRRRESRGLPWRVLERLLGLELKMRQYEAGRRFCDAVVQSAGTEALALAWRSPDQLPTAAELEEPESWLRRVCVPA